MNPDALEIEAGGNGHMMQMRFGQPLVRTTSQSRRAYRLRDRPFNPCPPRVLLPKGRRGLLTAPLSVRTLSSHRTGAAGRRRKTDHHRVVWLPIRRLGPAHTGLALRTDGHLP